MSRARRILRAIARRWQRRDALDRSLLRLGPLEALIAATIAIAALFLTLHLILPGAAWLIGKALS